MLHVTQPTVNKDLAYIRQQAQNNLQHHIHEVVPMEYERCMTGMKRNLKQTLEIAETSSDPKIKLEAMRIANECDNHIMNLTTNGVIVNDALRCIQSKMDNLNTIHKLDEKIEAIDEETTTNGVF